MLIKNPLRCIHHSRTTFQLIFKSLLKKKATKMTALDKPIFRDLAADDKDQEITEVTSVCMNCYEDVSFELILINF